MRCQRFGFMEQGIHSRRGALDVINNSLLFLNIEAGFKMQLLLEVTSVDFKSDDIYSLRSNSRRWIADNRLMAR